MYVTFSTEIEQAQAPIQCPEQPNPARPVQLKSGAYLYYEGDEVTHVYRVLRGVVRLTRLLEDGRRQVISFGYPGDVIGFPADGLHHADCNALVETELQAFRRSALEHGDSDPDLHEFLLGAALNEISAMQDHFMMLGRKSAAEKVASFLRVITDRYGKTCGGQRQITLPMGRGDIADFLGLTTETVCRSLSALRKSGTIRLDGTQTIVILCPERLRSISQGDD